MKPFAVIAALLAVCATAQAQAQEQEQAPKIETGQFGAATILRPEGEAHGVVFLFSGAEGWSDTETSAAQQLQKAGAFVVEADLKSYAARLNADDGECLYLVSDIEAISYQLQRSAGMQSYRSPVLAGFGAGGGLVLSIAQQTPAATVGRVVAIDPAAAPSFSKPLCGLDRTVPEVGVDSVEARFTPAATQAGRDLVASLIKAGVTIDADDSPDTAVATLVDSVGQDVQAQATGAGRLAAIPIVELPTGGSADTLAVVYSGDGGWRDLDKTIAENFQAHGVPTIGVDSLRYFWSRKTPAETASDLALLIEAYSTRWGTKRVILVGYSFGADVLPETYNLLPATTKAAIRQISLLGLGDEGEFEISVEGWLGGSGGDSRPVLPQIERINPKLLQCFDGSEEDDSECPKLKTLGAEIVTTEGGHHFDGDYDALATKILEGAKRRL
jgi:type IV secretory pathway VirJ component